MPSPNQILALNQMALAAVACGRKFQMPDVMASLTVAQGALESAYMEKITGDRNLFGIKSAPGAANFRMCETHETIHGISKIVMQPFRNYMSLQECFEDHARIFLTGGLSAKYRAWNVPGAKLGDLLAAISFPSNPPIYATDEHYHSSIAGMLAMPALQAAVAAALKDVPVIT